MANGCYNYWPNAQKPKLRILKYKLDDHWITNRLTMYACLSIDWSIYSIWVLRIWHFDTFRSEDTRQSPGKHTTVRRLLNDHEFLTVWLPRLDSTARQSFPELRVSESLGFNVAIKRRRKNTRLWRYSSKRVRDGKKWLEFAICWLIYSQRLAIVSYEDYSVMVETTPNEVYIKWKPI